MSNRILWLCGMVAWLAMASHGAAQNNVDGRPANAQPVREIFVPYEDLNLILESDPNRVYMTREEYEALVAEARQSPRLAKPRDVAVLEADYRGTLIDGRLQISGTLVFEVLPEEGVFLVPLALSGLGLQSAQLDGSVAPLTRPADGSTQLVLEGQGRHTLQLELTAAANIDAAQQKLKLALPSRTASRFELSVNGNVDIKSGAAIISRTYRETENVTDFELLPPAGAIELVFTVNNRQEQDNQIISAQSVVVSEVTQGYERLYATVSYRVFQGATDVLELQIPNGFEVTKVESTLLTRWEQTSENENEQQLKVFLREPATDRLILQLTANRSPQTGIDWIESLATWSFPRVAPLNTGSHVSVVGLLLEERLQSRLFTATNLLPLDASVLNRAIPASVLDAEPGAPSIRQVAAYFAPQPDFDLSAEIVRPEVELQVASSQILMIGDKGLELSGRLVVAPVAEQLHDLNLRVPADWQISAFSDSQGKPLAFEKRSTETGDDRYLIRLPQGIPAGSKTSFGFQMRKTPDGWLQEWTNQQLEFPKLTLDGVTDVTGALAVQTLDDLRVTPGDVTNLIPILENEKAELGIGSIPTALAYRFDNADYTLPLDVERTDPILTARCRSFLKIEPGNLTAHYELNYEIRRARVRTVEFSLPLDTPLEVRVVSYPENQVSEVTREDDENRRRWSVKLQGRQLGALTLLVHFQQPLDDVESAAIDLPLIQAEGVALQSGLFALEGDPELEIELLTDARRVDVGELTTPSYAIGRRLVGSYGYVGPAIAATATVNTRVAYGLPPAIAQRAELISRVSASGKTQSVARYDLLSKASLLEVVLPADSSLWTIFLDGQPTKPQRDGDRLLLGLSAQGQTTLRRLQIVYETPTSPFGLTGRVNLAPPVLSVRNLDEAESYLIPQADLEWQILLPSGYQIQWTDGTMTGPTGSPTTSTVLEITKWLVFAMGGTQGVASPLASRAATMLESAEMPSMAMMDSAGSEPGGYADDMAMGFDGSEEMESGSEETPSPTTPTREPLPPADPAEQSADDPFDSRSAQTDGGDGDAAPAAPQTVADPQNIPQSQSVANWALEGVSSLQIDLDSSGESRNLFHSLGESPQVTVAMVSGRSLKAAALGLGLLALLIGVALYRKSIATRVRWISLLLILGIVPLIATSRFDGIAVLFDGLFFAGCALVPIYVLLSVSRWAWSGLCSFCCQCCRTSDSTSSSSTSSSSAVTTGMIGLTLALLLSGEAIAQQPPGSVVDLAALENLLKTLEGPVAVPGDAIVVPYDVETTPDRSPDQKLLVPYEHYARLWNLAHPDKQLDAAPAPLSVAVSSATYQARIEDADSLAVKGTLEIFAYSDEPQVVPLGLSGAVVIQATLDGDAARLQFTTTPSAQQQVPEQQQAKVAVGNQENQLLLWVQGKGRHVLELDLRVGLTRQGAWRVADARLPSAAARRLELTIAEPQTEVTQQGLVDVPNRESTAAGEVWNTTLNADGRLAIRWRTKLSEAQIDQALTARSQAVLDVREDSIRLAWHVDLEFGRSTRDTFSFDVPGDYVVEQVTGANVRGHSSRPEADRQQVDVTLLKPVQNRESFTLVMSKRGAVVGEGATELDVPVIQVRDAALESGEVLIRRSPRLDLQTLLSDGISRYDENESLLAVARQSDAEEAAILAPSAFQAFRFVKPPFALRLKVQPLPEEPTVFIRSALRIAALEVTLDSGIDIRPQGQPIYRLDLEIPKNFKPLRVGNGAQDWSLIEQESQNLLTVRFLEGQTEPFLLPLLARLEAPFTELADGVKSMPLPELSVRRAKTLTGEIVIVPDPDTDVQLVDLVSCQSSPLTRGPGWLAPDQQQLAKAIVRFSKAGYQGLVRLSPRTPQVTSSSVTNVLITERSIEETVLIDVFIEQAGIREISMLVPDYLAEGQLNAKLLKQKVLSPATDADGQPIVGWQRMTLQLQDDVRGRYSLLLEGDRLLSDAAQIVQLPVVETGSSTRRLVAVENAGRDEIVIDSNQIVALESLNPQQQAWRDLTAVLGNTISQAFIATDDSLQPQLTFQTVERQQVQRAGARIGLAQTTLIVDESGGYRAFVDFRVSNADEPFLELELPQGASLWTVSVAGEPGKAIQVPGGNANRVRIPLVKTAEGEGDYSVQIKYAGKMDLRTAGQPVSFPLIRSANINIELSQVRLLLPETVDWFDFNGTMRLVQDEGELAQGFQSYLNKRIQEATQALSSGSNEFSKVRAAVNLSQSRQLMEASRREVARSESGEEYYRLLDRNDALLTDAEQQAEFELLEDQRDSLDNRSRLNEAWSVQDVQRSKNIVNGRESNFESSFGRPQSGESQKYFNMDWLEQNKLKSKLDELPANEGEASQSERKENSAKLGRLRRGIDDLKPGKPGEKGGNQDLSKDLDFGQIASDELLQKSEQQESAPQAGQGGRDKAAQLRQYQQQLESLDLSVERSNQPNAGMPPTAGPGAGDNRSGGFGGGGGGTADYSVPGQSGGAPGDETSALFGGMGFLAGPAPQADGRVRFDDTTSMVETGYASLDVRLPERGRVYRFTTPRGDMEITARPVSAELPGRGLRLLQIVGLLLGLWIVTRPRVRRLTSTVTLSLVFAILLAVVGLYSLAVGPLPVLGLVMLLAGGGLITRWFALRTMRRWKARQPG